MTGFITDVSGAVQQLPQLLSWDVCHGFCSPCDSFEVSFVYSAAMLPALKKAVSFRASHDGETVFRGVVDEFQLSADVSGCAAVLRGRGMQALLLDNQAESVEYTGATAQYILSRHAEPWGVKDVDTAGLENIRADLSVSSGSSQWSVISRFAEFCAGMKPRFDREGRLILNGAKGTRELEISYKTPISAQTYTQDRYGVISQATVKNRVLGTSVTVENAPFLALGGRCLRLVNVPRKTTWDAMRYTGTYQIKKSAEEFRRCSLTVPELFAAFPGDVAVLEGTPLGITGRFLVWETRCWADGESAGTVIELVEETT
jgi:hypothetical protein